MKIFLFKRFGVSGLSRGIAALEFALILPLLVILAFGIIDFGRLINARLVITNVSREGGNLASRYRDVEIQAQANDLLNLLQISGKPLDLDTYGKIYITKILAGTSTHTQPTIAAQVGKGNLSVSSKIVGSSSTMGLSQQGLFNHLVFNASHQTADISEITVVEVFYKYKPITPLPGLIQNILTTPGYDGIVIGSKAVF
jgi:Flp pilus assembly protein TadG